MEHAAMGYLMHGGAIGEAPGCSCHAGRAQAQSRPAEIICPQSGNGMRSGAWFVDGDEFKLAGRVGVLGERQWIRYRPKETCAYPACSGRLS